MADNIQYPAQFATKYKAEVKLKTEIPGNETQVENVWQNVTLRSLIDQKFFVKPQILWN